MEIAVQNISQDDKMPYDLLLQADPSKEIIDDYIRRGSCYRASVIHDGMETVIGVFVLLKTRPGTIEIVNIALTEEYQGKGLGKWLVSQAIERAKMEDAKTIEIGTGNSSIKQLALYQKCGFRIIGIEHDYFVRHYQEKIYENGIPCRDMIRLRMDL